MNAGSSGRGEQMGEPGSWPRPVGERGQRGFLALRISGQEIVCLIAGQHWHPVNRHRGVRIGARFRQTTRTGAAASALQSVTTNVLWHRTIYATSRQRSTRSAALALPTAGSFTVDRAPHLKLPAPPALAFPSAGRRATPTRQPPPSTPAPRPLFPPTSPDALPSLRTRPLPPPTPSPPQPPRTAAGKPRSTVPPAPAAKRSPIAFLPV